MGVKKVFLYIMGFCALSSAINSMRSCSRNNDEYPDDFHTSYNTTPAYVHSQFLKAKETLVVPDGKTDVSRYKNSDAEKMANIFSGKAKQGGPVYDDNGEIVTNPESSSSFLNADKALQTTRTTLSQSDKKLQEIKESMPSLSSFDSLKPTPKERITPTKNLDSSFTIDVKSKSGSDVRFNFNVVKKEGNQLLFKYTMIGNQDSKFDSANVNVVYWDASKPSKQGMAFSLSFYEGGCLVYPFKSEVSSQIYLNEHDRVCLTPSTYGLDISSKSVDLSRASVINKDVPRVIETRPVPVSPKVKKTYKQTKAPVQIPTYETSFSL